MTIEITVDNRSGITQLPDEVDIRNLVTKVVADLAQHAQVHIHFVNVTEGRELNYQYRNTNRATNVLSFPFSGSSYTDPPLLGDIVLCAEVIIAEAQKQSKSIYAHCIHLLVHGVLHLFGYDHQLEQEAEIMESKEIAILKRLEIDDPYLTIN